MNIDAHLHIWDPGRAEYTWMDEDWSLTRAVGFAEVAPTLAELGVEGVVLVEAADNAEDTTLMLDAALVHPEVVAVVAWAPLDRPDELPARLEELRATPIVTGVRNLFHTHPIEWATSPEVDRGIGLVAEAGLSLDFVTGSPAALRDVPRIARRHPGLRIVVDHLGKPPVGQGEEERRAWRDLIAAVAENPLAHAKLSGLYASSGAMDGWTVDGIRPFVEDALDLFGPDRLMFGSDWPIALLAGGYRRGWEAITSLVAALSPEEQTSVRGGTAARFYRTRPIA